ncbi:hypothetical protein GGP49_002973 [Salinibacter ruber]|uniref:hypothetical protein n=1 Tax=Salinibacter ruber TaxID=146919 RepID=UPI002166E6BD|nr:hypothetical protein [Salinibacter ruber]MCS4116023.1 hypothetical protein [Salinibacter ruber]
MSPTENSFRPRVRAPETDKETVGVFEWLITIPLMVVPPLNVVLAAALIYFDQTSQTKRNFYAAVIILSSLAFACL